MRKIFLAPKLETTNRGGQTKYNNGINMNRNLTELILGVVVLIVATFFMWSALEYSGSAHKSRGYIAYAQFDRADGVDIGSVIRIAGVRVGEVTAIELNPKTFRAKLSLIIEKAVKLPEDSIVEISSESLMGGKYLNIIPGGSDRIISEGDHFIFTQSSISFEGLLSKFLFSQGSENK